MGLIDKIQNSYLYTHWKVGKYTKRRGGCPDLDRRDSRYYERNYVDGVYLDGNERPTLSKSRSFLKRKTSQVVRSSETYNDM
ncbi:hypothetical protein K493DRAFT_316447 [Basidiobolus meristosporus CBS 931.73]|uniref:Uncharacterized protein n=1 Tax=Basidiobolus meristosporus CBS 931.73 TaxID=1314790 RepID=A0A1Y1Y4M5_9FUNG|nr:hypothetical protein K493DRAFT_316447 [Basidiobolus meristosporus CBS 931.73]|eukprot:ORX92676.1 hypothetical protein K493DRAFT_316447 [Basidiobolus meristosporus CBS 931.73]